LALPITGIHIYTTGSGSMQFVCDGVGCNLATFPLAEVSLLQTIPVGLIIWNYDTVKLGNQKCTKIQALENWDGSKWSLALGGCPVQSQHLTTQPTCRPSLHLHSHCSMMLHCLSLTYVSWIHSNNIRQTTYQCAIKSWQVASLIYHTEPEQKKITKRTKNKNGYSSEETLEIIILGVTPDGRESMVGRICERDRF